MTNRYPDPNEVDERLYERLRELPSCGGDCRLIDLEWVQANLWREAAAFDIPKTSVVRGMQANMFGLEMESSAGERRKLVCKRIVPAELPEKKNLQVWKTFLQSVRREMNFYKMIESPEYESVRRLFPGVLHQSSTDPAMDDTDPMATAFLLIMQDLASQNYYQAPSMNREQATATLKALATLHASFWEQDVVLQQLERGGFWVLQRRKLLNELETAESAWQDLLVRMPELKEDLADLDHLADICSQLVKHAEDLDSFVSSRCHTLIHGDCKGWNLFLGKKKSDGDGCDGDRDGNDGNEDGDVVLIGKKETAGDGDDDDGANVVPIGKKEIAGNDGDDVVLIDMQWAGKGHALQDVAYVLTTSLEASLLSTEEFERLVDVYINSLGVELKARGRGGLVDLGALRSEFDLVWLDYARVIVTGLWRNLSKERMKQYQNTVGPSMINRSLQHVKFIITRLHKLLFEEGSTGVLKRLQSLNKVRSI